MKRIETQKSVLSDEEIESKDERVQGDCKLKYKKLGKSGIKVSEIGFGAWTIALNWWGKRDPGKTKRKECSRRHMMLESTFLKLPTCMEKERARN